MNADCCTVANADMIRRFRRARDLLLETDSARPSKLPASGPPKSLLRFFLPPGGKRMATAARTAAAATARARPVTMVAKFSSMPTGHSSSWMNP